MKLKLLVQIVEAKDLKMTDSKLETLIKRHENDKLRLGDRKAGMPHWDKTGQSLWQGIAEQMYKRAGVSATDELGKLTAGYGFNLEVEWPEELWNHILMWHVAQAIQHAEKYEWFSSLNTVVEGYGDWHSGIVSPRQAVIISMIFQLGPQGFAGFKRMIAALEADMNGEPEPVMEIAGENVRVPWFHIAGKEMVESKWVRQTPRRAQELAEMMRTGEWPSDLQDLVA